MKKIITMYLLLATAVLARDPLHGVYFKLQALPQVAIQNTTTTGTIYSNLAQQNLQMRIGVNHGFESLPFDLGFEIGQRRFAGITEQTATTSTYVKYDTMQFHGTSAYRSPYVDIATVFGAARVVKRTSDTNQASTKVSIRPLLGIGLQKFIDSHWFVTLSAECLLGHNYSANLDDNIAGINYLLRGMGYLV